MPDEKRIYIRIEPETRRAVGIEILSCAKILNKGPKEITPRLVSELIEKLGPIAQRMIASDNKTASP
jgi:hypothetical protein